MRHLKWLALVLFSPALAFGADTGSETIYVRSFAQCPSFNGDGSAYACAASNGGVGAKRGFSAVNGSATPESDTAGVIDGGDTLLVCGADFDSTDIDFTGPDTMLNPSTAMNGSSSSRRIVISGDCSGAGGPSTAVLDGEGTVDYGIYHGCTYCTIQDIHFKNFDKAGLVAGSYSSTTNDLILQRLQFTNIAHAIAGTSGQNCIEAGSVNFNMDDITINGCGNDGIVVTNGNDDTYGTITNYTGTNIGTDTTLNLADGIHVQPGVVSLTLDNITIDKLGTDKACFIINTSGYFHATDLTCTANSSLVNGIVIDQIGIPSWVKNSSFTGTLAAGVFLRDSVGTIAANLLLDGITITGANQALQFTGTHAGNIYLKRSNISGTTGIYAGSVPSPFNPGGFEIRYSTIQGTSKVLNIPSSYAVGDWTSDCNSMSGGGTWDFRGSSYATMALYSSASGDDVGSVAGTCAPIPYGHTIKPKKRR